MGRPPNPYSRRGLELSKKYFTVPIPPVDPRVSAAVESHIASTHPWLVQRAQLDKAESTLLQQRAFQEQAAQHVQELTLARHSTLQEIQVLREAQLQQRLQTIDTNMRRELAQQQAQQLQEFHAQCEALLNQVPPPEEEEEEQPPTKRHKTDTSVEESVEEGQIPEETDESTEATSNTEARTAAAAPEEIKPSQLKRKQLEEAQHQLEELMETKHQMIWLLKQVIKAEQKQKIQANTADGKAAT